MNFHGSDKGIIINASRRLFCIILLVFLLGCQPRVDSLTPASPTPGLRTTITSQAEYLVHQELTLANEGPGKPEKQNIWVALIHDFPPYQGVLSMEVSPKDYYSGH